MVPFLSQVTAPGSYPVLTQQQSRSQDKKIFPFDCLRGEVPYPATVLFSSWYLDAWSITLDIFSIFLYHDA
jgi:hypothetical protein